MFFIAHAVAQLVRVIAKNKKLVPTESVDAITRLEGTSKI